MAENKEAAAAVKKKVAQAASGVTEAAGTAGRTVKETTRKTTGTARAVRAARAGRIEEARELVQDADLDEGMATKALAEAEALQYQVEVNKRGLSVSALTKTLNERWDNGWRLAHILEQRGNTVLIFEKRS